MRAVTSDFLARMARSSHERVRAARAALSEAALLEQALAAPPPAALRLDRFDVIAELKLRSPAAGGLAADGFDRNAQLDAYARGGAAAISVLTEPAEFKGELAHLADAAALLAPRGVPAMRKDFITDPYQVLEARAAGAGGVLVIVTMLDDATVRDLLDCARRLGMFVLLEGFDEPDLERIGNLLATAPRDRKSEFRSSAVDIAPAGTVARRDARAGASRDGFTAFPAGAMSAAGLRNPKAGDSVFLAGVNCRDLRTLDVRFERFTELAPRIPRNVPVVAESGIASVDDVRSVAGLGYRAALVGSSLMRAASPAAFLSGLVAAGRAAREA
jgi:indole-3-glycerol phosphate synthase